MSREGPEGHERKLSDQVLCKRKDMQNCQSHLNRFSIIKSLPFVLCLRPFAAPMRQRSTNRFDPGMEIAAIVSNIWESLEESASADFLAGHFPSPILVTRTANLGS